MIESQALKANISNIDVRIDPRYVVILEVMSKYFGLTEGITTFLKELSHPQKNLQFIVKEARNYALNYFHLMNEHADGAQAAQRFADIFLRVIMSSPKPDVRAEAADNLLLFLQKIIKDSKSGFENFFPVLNDVFLRIAELDDADFFLFVKSYYRLEKIAESLPQNISGAEAGYRNIDLLLLRYYRHTYSYWLSQPDPWAWFAEEAEEAGSESQAFFADISLKRIGEWEAELEKLARDMDIASREFSNVIIRLPAYSHFTDIYRNIPQRLMKSGSKSGKGMRWKFVFLFHILNISGLSSIHEEALREINRSLTWLIAHENRLNIEKIMEKTFSILKARMEEFPDTALNCVLNMGDGVYKTDESDLINLFIRSVLDLGFRIPGITGVGNDWQIMVNPAHIRNIRTWLDLICLNPKYSTRLLSSLIIHLSLYGVFIKDTDLFPRNITALLNSNIGEVYNLVKQLTRLFPVYFNDIGAEGALRDISTRIDEISHRRDVLVHFLRKQTHVESSSRVVGFIEAVFVFWETRDKRHLEPYIPPNIYERIESQGHYVDGMHRIFSYLKEKNGLTLPHDLLTIGEEEAKAMLSDISGVPDSDIERAGLAVAFYQLLHRKYDISASEIHHHITQLSAEAFPNIHKLKDALEEPDIRSKTFALLEFTEFLKDLILSPKRYEARENIYKKRHFTIDIPSMYGNYHELKFDALGLTFRIESLVNVLLEQIIENIDLSLITRAAFVEIFDILMLFNKALKTDGISSVEFDLQLDLLYHSLEARGFTFTQYLDIFKGFGKAVKNIINDHFTNIHGKNLDSILSRIPSDRILPKYLSQNQDVRDDERFGHRVSEIFFRDRIALSIGLRQLDLFLSRILATLHDQASKVPSKLRLLLNYDPQRAMMSIDKQKSKITSIIYLGNKGFNLVKLHNFGFPVPPGFIITTEVFRCRDIIDGYRPANKNFREQVALMVSVMEMLTGKRFADPSNPLVFSVRSGSSISQPGMMDTFLNVGMNEKIAEGLARKTGNTWFAWDNYRRFVQCYGMSYGLNRDDFDAIIKDHKKKCNIPLKRGFTGEQMRMVALAYEELVRDSGIEVPEDPYEQLMMTIKQVLNSWDSPKAQVYRKIMGISDDWGTAVTVQSMVFGNMSRESGTGVFFTHNPKWSEDSLRLWGDFTLGNQGEDVVSGLVNTLPISIIQQDSEMRDTDTTLESHFPKIYNALKEMASDLIYKKGWSPQEMEFTFESPSPENLYLLQTRDMAMRELQKAPVFDVDSIREKPVLGNGIGVSGGAMSGRVVFTLEEISEWKKREPETPLILLRNDTVPDDIREVNAADGLLTARGGMTSHAAVVAHRLGKTCVVGCGNLLCNEEQKNCVFDNERVIHSGDHLSIDGREGLIYHGLIAVKEE